MTRIQKVFIWGAIAALPVLAQEDRAVLTGTVSDASRAPIPGAVIQIDSLATGFHREVKSNDAGAYTVPGLQVGSYNVKIAKDGFRVEDFQQLVFVVGQTRTLNVQLQIGSNSQQVQVEADVPPLEQSASTVGGVVNATQVKNLPLNGRAWTSLMALVPGAIDSGGGTQKTIRFAGRGTDDNNYRFDGLDATGISNQGPNATFRLQISTEAIAEFKVDSVLYSADTGGTAGGQVEVISKSGTNQYHGSAFEYLRNDALNTRGPFDGSTLPPLRLNQFGGSVGGSVIKNRTFFFAAYEGLRQRVGTTLIGSVPSDSFRAAVLAKSPALAPILAAYPVGNVAFSQNVSRFISTGNLASDEDSGLIRVDHRIADNTNFFARYNIDQAQRSAPSGSLRDLAQTSSSPMNGSLNLSHVFSSTMFNVLQLGVNRIRTVNHTQASLFTTSKIFNSVTVPGLTKLAQATDAVVAPTSYTVKDDFSWVRGNHTLKAGIEIKRVLYNYSQASENALVFTSPADFINNSLNQVNLIGGVPTHGLHKTEYFGYAQDQWKVRRDLVATVGLRYEYFNRFTEIYGRDLPFDIKTCGGPCPAGSEFSIPVTNNFEPRVSLAWSPESLHGKLVIRPGFGLYKGEGQLGDLNAPSDNYTQRLTLSVLDFPALSFPAERFFGQASNQAVSPRALERDRQDPTVAQWGMQVQSALPEGFVLDTGYIGYHGYHQFTRSYVNVINPSTGTRPIAGYGQIDIKRADSNNTFNGWQTSLQRQFRSGWLFVANYMWSHAINDASTGGGEAGYPENVACRSCERASGDQDVRHVFSSNTVYQLPFGRGRKYLSHGGFPDALLGGWQFSGIGIYRSGLPVNVILSRAASSVPDGNADEHGGAAPQRPDLVYGVSTIPPGGRKIGQYINPAAFAIPANGTWGNAGRNLIRGPELWQADISLSKSFRVTEHSSLDFRGEGFNIFNRAQFANPDGNFNTPNFGVITTTINNGSATGSGTPRQFQFSLRVSF